jgi:hypothetical protein
MVLQPQRNRGGCPVGDTGYPLTLSLTRRGEGTIETPFSPGEREKVMGVNHD